MQLGRRHHLTCGIILNTLDALERPELVRLRHDIATRVFHICPLHLFFPRPLPTAACCGRT
uniref:Uncharacterized protein n=1 Tax=Aegilops tauschii subsp. strangulata TaxID=200361 RepID=A0A453J3G1_AEGTS